MSSLLPSYLADLDGAGLAKLAEWAAFAGPHPLPSIAGVQDTWDAPPDAQLLTMEVRPVLQHSRAIWHCVLLE